MRRSGRLPRPCGGAGRGRRQCRVGLCRPRACRPAAPCRCRAPARSARAGFSIRVRLGAGAAPSRRLQVLRGVLPLPQRHSPGGLRVAGAARRCCRCSGDSGIWRCLPLATAVAGSAPPAQPLPAVALRHVLTRKAFVLKTPRRVLVRPRAEHRGLDAEDTGLRLRLVREQPQSAASPPS